MAITFDPAYNGSHFTFSPDYLTATASQTFAFNNLRALMPKNAGQLHWEMLAPVIGSSAETAIGLANVNASTNQQLGATPHTIGWIANGNLNYNGSTVASGTGYSTSDVLGFDLDIGSATLTCSKNGTAIYSNISISSLIADSNILYAAASSWVSGDKFTARFTAASWTETNPGGFAAYDTGQIAFGPISSAIQSGGSSAAVSVNTYVTSCVLIAFLQVNSTSASFTTSLSSGSVTWNPLASVVNTVTGYARTEVWYALATTQLTADVTTISTTATMDDLAIQVIPVMGVSSLVFDTDGSLPATHAYPASTSSLSLTVSTSEPDDLIFGVIGTDENQSLVISTPATGFTPYTAISNTGGTHYASLISQFKLVDATQSSTAVNATMNHGHAYNYIVFAMTADSGGATLAPVGIAAADALGSPVLNGGAAGIAVSGIAAADALGAPTLAGGPASLAPSGIAAADALGAPTISAVTGLAPSGIAAADALGNPNLGINPLGIAAADALGTPTLSEGAVMIHPTGIPAFDSFGTPALSALFRLAPSGIPAADALGMPSISVVVPRSPPYMHGVFS